MLFFGGEVTAASASHSVALIDRWGSTAIASPCKTSATMTAFDRPGGWLGVAQTAASCNATYGVRKIGAIAPCDQSSFSRVRYYTESIIVPDTIFFVSGANGRSIGGAKGEMTTAPPRLIVTSAEFGMPRKGARLSAA